MRTTIKNFPEVSKKIRSTDVYDVYDYAMKSMVLSMTVLHPDKCTSGHSHDDAEEVYIFIQGDGSMQLSDEEMQVSKDDIVAVPKGKFHKVFNNGTEDLIFLAIFQKYTGRGD